MHSCSEQGRRSAEEIVSSRPEVEARNSGKGRREGNFFMSLLIRLECNYAVLESLCWFHVLGYKGPRSVDFGGKYLKFFFFHPIFVIGQLYTRLVPAFI